MARKRKGNPIHGWVNFDKPLGMTSTQAVGKVRWLYSAQKAGHAGTLDPLATGILPIALGDATKTVPFMVDAVKAYKFTLTWGENTDTLDAEGDITEKSDVRPERAAIESALPNFVGVITQTPPRYSAIKIDGKRAYDLARSGEFVEMKSRQVRVDSVEIINCTAESVTLAVGCGKGTYIRSIARDLANTLGACGHVTMLRRTRVGPFTPDTAFTLDALENLCDTDGVSRALRPVETVLDDIPVLALTENDAEHMKHGRAIAAPPNFITIPDADDLHWALAMYGEKAVALCHVSGGMVSPKRVFNL